MITALIVLACIVAYLVCYTVVAGAWYRHLRPYTEPLNCDCYSPRSVLDHHPTRCYRRPGTMVDTNAEAMSYAMLVGLSGPLGVLAMGAVHFVSKWDKPLPEEVEVKIRRSERELGMK